MLVHCFELNSDRHKSGITPADIEGGSYCPTTGGSPSHCILFLKAKTEGDCFVSVSRLFQSFAPRYENDFLATYQLFSLESSNQQLYFEELSKEFLVKRIHNIVEQAH